MEQEKERGPFESAFWTMLLRQVHKGRCIPFLGAGASVPWFPLARDIAKRWAEKYEYPLEDKFSLTKVAQYLEMNNQYPKVILGKELKRINNPNFSLPEYSKTIHVNLAKLPLPIYVTTNYDHLMEAALESQSKKPLSEFYRMDETLKEYYPSIFDKEYRPTVEEPLVYHLHGDMEIPESMVLTEDDMFHFVHVFYKNKEIFSPSMKVSFLMSSFLFVGYSLEDMTIRLMFKEMVPRMHIASLAVRLPSPYGESANKWLSEKAEKLGIKLYYGNSEQFATELYELNQHHTDDNKASTSTSTPKRYNLDGKLVN